MSPEPSKPPKIESIGLVQSFIIDETDIQADSLAQIESQIRHEIRLEPDEPGQETPVPDLAKVNEQNFATTTMLELRYNSMNVRYETLQTAYRIIDEYFTEPKSTVVIERN